MSTSRLVSNTEHVINRSTYPYIFDALVLRSKLSGYTVPVMLKVMVRLSYLERLEQFCKDTATSGREFLEDFARGADGEFRHLTGYPLAKAAFRIIRQMVEP